jgi:hypothetical protein
MFAQAAIFISIAKNQTDFFGRLDSIACSFESSDIVFFPFTMSSGQEKKEKNNADKEEKTLVIQILRPYEMTELLKRLHITS